MSTPARAGGGLTRARSVALVVLITEFVVLVGSGVALLFWYHPAPGSIWAEPLGLSSAAERSNELRRIHDIAAVVAIGSAFFTAILFAVPRVRARRLVGVGLLVVVVAAAVTGPLLAWDQLAVEAVTIGEGLDGYRPFLREDVRFAVVDDSEVDPNTVLLWLGIHVVALSALGVALGIRAWRGRSAADSAP